MAKKLIAVVKLQCPAGAANPSPPVGPALGQHGVNIMEFCKQFNARTQAQTKDDVTIPVEITVYSDRSFTFITKTPPTSVLLRTAAGLEKAAENPGREEVGSITDAQLSEIAEIKLPDLTANDLPAAKKIVAGTARSMGIKTP